jgi:two-component system chemotaxis response regulator CheB
MQKESKYDLIVIGGSAGSLVMVLKILPFLKKKSNLAVIIVFHRKPTEDNALIEILSGRTKFVVKEADEKDELLPEMIYIAPADYHVLVEKDHTISLDVSERVNYCRPSIDVTFSSAAEVYKGKLVCMLLSGANADGVHGLIRAKSLGALIVVQDPVDAEVPFMPKEAVQHATVDYLINDSNIEELINLINA